MSTFQDETPGFTDPAEIDDGSELEPIEEAEERKADPLGGQYLIGAVRRVRR